ncbi:hypothetical protein U3A55_03000 [Salarchaeum sp. III]|uniref:hypothetical protein n=1 Tax=Salarchaeum sp. III TaxID=3107927 RepID=UPI002ED86F78
MRQPAHWMSPVDDRVLESVATEGRGTLTDVERVLRSTGGIATPSVERLGERCHVLADRGLLATPDDGVFELTASGERYLAGDLNADAL